MALAFKFTIENIFKDPAVVNEIKRKSSFYCLLMAPSDKKFPTKMRITKLDLDLIKIKHTRNGLRNIYSNNQQTHSHLNTVDTEALNSNRSKGDMFGNLFFVRKQRIKSLLKK